MLRNSTALTLAWLGGIGVTDLKTADHIYITTQEEFDKLADHSAASRLDITIRLVSGGKTELIFIESKLPSKQGYDQLQRYAEQLVAAKQSKGLDKTSLVFITRDYEASTTPKFADPGFKLTFLPTRWFHFYRYLKAHLNGDGLATELKLFMEENHMSLGNQFRSTDLVALENFFTAKSLMDETLEGVVSEAVHRTLSEVYAAKKGMTYFRDHHRYVVSNCDWSHLECHLGYWLPYNQVDEPVWVGVMIHCKPGSSARNEIIDAFRSWVNGTNGNWSAVDLEDERAWSYIRNLKALQTFMGEEDHVRAIKEYFLGLLQDVAAFRKAYPSLPWASTTAHTPDDGDEKSNSALVQEPLDQDSLRSTAQRPPN